MSKTYTILSGKLEEVTHMVEGYVFSIFNSIDKNRYTVVKDNNCHHPIFNSHINMNVECTGEVIPGPYKYTYRVYSIRNLRNDIIDKILQ